MPVRQHSDGNPDGQVFGQSTSDLISFYGATPVAQRSGAAQAAITDNTGGTASATLAAITAGASYAQADMVAVKNALATIAAKLNEVQATLVGLGLWKGSA